MKIVVLLIMWRPLFQLGVDDVCRVQHPIRNAGIYTPIMNRYINQLVIKIRKKHKGYHFSLQRPQNRIHGAAGEVSIYGFASDQSPRPKPKSYWRPFLSVKECPFLWVQSWWQKNTIQEWFTPESIESREGFMRFTLN